MASATSLAGAAAPASAVRHIGMSVASIDDALGFWESFLGVSARWRTTLDRPHPGQIVGVPGVSIKATFGAHAYLRIHDGIAPELFQKPQRA